VRERGTRVPGQRQHGVAELEWLRCGGDPLLELSAVVGDAAAAVAQGHPLLELSTVVGNLYGSTSPSLLFIPSGSLPI